MLSLLLLAFLLVPMIYYVRKTRQAAGRRLMTLTGDAATGSGSTTARTRDAPPTPPAPAARGAAWRNPWRRPWILEGFTWLYLIWSIVPIAIAVLFSFNNGKSQSVWQGFSTRWYSGDPVNSVALNNPSSSYAVIQTLRLSVLTTMIAVPLGVAFAIGIDRWRTRTSTTFNFVMVFSFVIPELIFGVAMFFLFTQLFKAHPPGHPGRGAGPGHLELLLAGHHRAGPSGLHRQLVRGGGGRPRRIRSRRSVECCCRC